MRLAITGHRPKKLGGYSPHINDLLKSFLSIHLDHYKPSDVITGMALGVDQAMAEACIILGIPFIAAIPCDDYESKWPSAAQERYHDLISHACAVALVSPGPYEAWKMQKRNEYIVDNLNPATDTLLALWDGSPSGTLNCIKYAESRSVRVTHLWEEYSFLFETLERTTWRQKGKV